MRVWKKGDQGVVLKSNAGNPGATGRRRVRCPICRKQLQVKSGDALHEHPFFPFCSKKCKMIDLGRWFNEEYRIAVEDTQDEDDYEDIPEGPLPS